MADVAMHREWFEIRAGCDAAPDWRSVHWQRNARRAAWHMSNERLTHKGTRIMTYKIGAAHDEASRSEPREKAKYALDFWRADQTDFDHDEPLTVEFTSEAEMRNSDWRTKRDANGRRYKHIEAYRWSRGGWIRIAIFRGRA